VSPVKYKLGFYIPEDDDLHSRRRENLKSYIILRIVHISSTVTSYRPTDSPFFLAIDFMQYSHVFVFASR
jgi:hypothetical protein